MIFDNIGPRIDDWISEDGWRCRAIPRVDINGIIYLQVLRSVDYLNDDSEPPDPVVVDAGVYRVDTVEPNYFGCERTTTTWNVTDCETPPQLLD